MEQKIFHGSITVTDLAQGIISHFNRGNYRVYRSDGPTQTIVQVASVNQPSSGGQTALTISLQPIEDGVSVSIGNQEWLGLAASLGQTVISILQNPINLLGRLDDLAQDIESLQLTQEIWSLIEGIARSLNSNQELSERFKRITCNYCKSANPVGESRCLACGAPLGDEQPQTCTSCGYILKSHEVMCPNCGKPTR
jgi:RNA polymerase subunit RPABC4/transcription elongation factor Spt4